MPKPSKFKRVKTLPKRPASSIETIADVISISASPLDHHSDGKASATNDHNHQPSKRAKTAHHSSSPHAVHNDDDDEPKFAPQPPSTSAPTDATTPAATAATATTAGTGTGTVAATAAALAPTIKTTTTPDPYAILPAPLAARLRARYDTHAISILSSSKISAKVSALLARLENGFDLAARDQRPGVVAVTARARGGAAGKLVSVVEIAKRELERRRVRWFQYCGVGGVLGAVKERKGDGGRGWGKGRVLSGEAKERTEVEGGEVDMEGTGEELVEVEDDEDDEEEAFETMGTGVALGEQREKVRTVPVLTIYLSRVPVPELKEEYGEQSHDPRKPLVVD